MRSAYQFARRVALTGMAVSGVLAVLKIVAGTRAGSAATVADGFESAADVAASGLLSLGLTLAARPADENHPYGHGRFEILTGLLIGLLLVATGAGIASASWLTLGHASPPPGMSAVWALILSLVAKGAMSYQKIRLGRRIRSSALEADGKNDLVDLISGSTALVCVGLNVIDPARFRHADSVGAVLVGVLVIFLGIQVIRETAEQLVDTMPAGERLQEMRAAAMLVPGVKRIEKVHARKTGLRWHVDMHVHVDPQLTVEASHRIAGKVKAALREELDWIENVLIHIEPASD